MKRLICNCCEKEIEYRPIYHIDVDKEGQNDIHDKDEFTLCQDCFQKTFNKYPEGTPCANEFRNNKEE